MADGQPPREQMRVSRRTLLGSVAAAGAGVMLPAGASAAPIAGQAGAAVQHLAGNRNTDVVIVGAGLAGLNAARLLVERGIDVVVLEARARVGGRTLSYQFDDGKVLDVGGQWIGPLPGVAASSTIPGEAVYAPQQAIYDLATETFGLSTFHTYDQQGMYVDFNSGRRSTYGQRIPTDPGTVNAAESLLLLNTMAKQVNPAHPWDTPSATQALQWDSQTVDTWIRQNLLPPDQGAYSATYSLTTLAIESVSGPCEPKDLSLLDMLASIASAGNLDNMVNTTGGAQDSRIVGGAQQVSILMAAALGDRVVLNAPVRNILQRGSDVLVSGDGFSVAGHAVIVAIPPTLTGRINYDPPMAQFDGGLRDQLVQRSPMGSTIKVQVIYPKPYWRSQGLNGQVTSDTGPIKTTFDNTPFETSQAVTDGADVGPGVLVGFMDADDARVWGQKTMAERQAAVLAQLSQYFPGGPDPIGYLEMNWSAEQYTGGCYNSYFPPGVWTSFGTAVSQPIGRIFWACADISPIWTGYMDGAIRSGAAAAENVAALL
jgi:monoamine oxidase